MSGTLPADGPASVGGVALPSGGRAGEFLWSTHEALDDGLGLWSALAARFGETGLWPVIAFGYAGDWDLEPDEDWEQLAGQDAESLLRRAWSHGDEFPGLGHGGAANGDAPKPVGEAIAGLALVAVPRGADVPGLIGWESRGRPGRFQRCCAPGRIATASNSWDWAVPACTCTSSAHRGVRTSRRPPLNCARSAPISSTTRRPWRPSRCGRSGGTDALPLAVEGGLGVIEVPDPTSATDAISSTSDTLPRLEPRRRDGRSRARLFIHRGRAGLALELLGERRLVRDR